MPMSFATPIYTRLSMNKPFIDGGAARGGGDSMR